VYPDAEKTTLGVMREFEVPEGWETVGREHADDIASAGAKRGRWPDRGGGHGLKRQASRDV